MFMILLSLLSASCLQAENSAISEYEKPPIIILFGGAGATGKVMKTCKGQKFYNFGYKNGKKQRQNVVDLINKHPNRRYIVAGHSSGAKHSNWVGRNVSKKARPSIRLLSLDGFAPRDLQKILKTECWTATNGRKLWAKNIASMTEENCGKVRTITVPHCKAKWCLHFALVNTNAPKYLNEDTFWEHGYDNCSANMEWAKAWESQ